MMIEPEDIKGFQRLWKEQFHIELSEEEAQVKASCLLEMMKVIYRPIPKSFPKPEEKTQLSILDFNQYEL